MKSAAPHFKTNQSSRRLRTSWLATAFAVSLLGGCSTADFNTIMTGVARGLDQSAQTMQRDAAAAERRRQQARNQSLPTRQSNWEAQNAAIKEKARREAANRQLQRIKADRAARQSAKSRRSNSGGSSSSSTYKTAVSENSCLMDNFELYTQYGLQSHYCEAEVATNDKNGYFRYRVITGPDVYTAWPNTNDLALRSRTSQEMYRRIKSHMRRVVGSDIQGTIECSGTAPSNNPGWVPTRDAADRIARQGKYEFERREVGFADNSRGNTGNVVQHVNIAYPTYETSRSAEVAKFKRRAERNKNLNSCVLADNLRQKQKRQLSELN